MIGTRLGLIGTLVTLYADVDELDGSGGASIAAWADGDGYRPRDAMLRWTNGGAQAVTIGSESTPAQLLVDGELAAVLFGGHQVTVSAGQTVWCPVPPNVPALGNVWSLLAPMTSGAAIEMTVAARKIDTSEPTAAEVATAVAAPSAATIAAAVAAPSAATIAAAVAAPSAATIAAAVAAPSAATIAAAVAAPSAGTIAAAVAAPTAAAIADAVLAEAVADHAGTAGSLAQTLLLIKGLVNGNVVHDQHVYNGTTGLLETVRIRVFPTGADAIAGTNAVATFNVVAVNGANGPTSYRVAQA